MAKELAYTNRKTGVTKHASPEDIALMKGNALLKDAFVFEQALPEPSEPRTAKNIKPAESTEAAQ